MNNKNKEDISDQNKSKILGDKRSIIPMKTFIYVGIALIVGFLGGIKFADQAHKKATDTSAGMVANIPGMNAGMQGTMPPGKVNMDIPQAIAKMEEMVKDDPQNLQLLEHLGNLYFDTDQPQKAIDMYERALAIHRHDPDILTDCGIMYRALKKYDKAIAYFKEASQVKPDHFQSWYNLGIVYREDLKEYQKAVDAWDQLLKNIPGSEHAEIVRSEIQKTKALIK